MFRLHSPPMGCKDPRPRAQDRLGESGGQRLSGICPVAQPRPPTPVFSEATTMQSRSPSVRRIGVQAALTVLALVCGASAAVAAGKPKAAAQANGQPSVYVQDGWVYTHTFTATGQPLVTATKAAAAAGVIPVGDSRVYGNVFDK